MRNLLVDKENITRFIPHRRPIIMVDELLEHNEGFTKTTFKIEPDNIFLRDGLFQESGIIENMAQSAALGAGYYCHANKLEQPITYIVSIQQLDVNKFPSVGDLLVTSIQVESSIMNINVIVGECYLNNELIARGEMKVMMENNPG